MKFWKIETKTSLRTKIIKILRYVSLSILIVILFLSIAYSFRTDPIMMISGKKLSGMELPYPESWEFTNAYPTIKVETNPEDPHSVTTLCFIREGKLIIPSQDGNTKVWPKYVLKNNHVRIKVGDKVYPVRLTLLEKDAKITEFGPFLTVKFLIEFSQNPEKYLRVCGFLKSQKDSLLGIQ